MLLLALLLAACDDDPKPRDTDVPVDTDEPDIIDADNDGSPAGEDCDDADPDAYPGAPEACDGVDQSCDGQVDEGVLDPYYSDEDLDGYGTGEAVEACEAPVGHAAFDGDCDDADAAYHPGANESCADPADYNCDGSTGYVDGDLDGFAACEECDDRDPAVSPIAVEMCDAIDNNCDGAIDEDDAGDARIWYADTDADGYGDPTASRAACAMPEGFRADATDCDDAEAGVNPGAAEVCNGIDEDCDGDIDEDDALDAATWYADADGDGYGDAATPTRACDAPADHVADATDCDDAHADALPGGTEVCDARDNDCDGDTDEPAAVDAPTWYADADGDAYGDAATPTRACEAPAGHVADATDCDDAHADALPGGTEVCDARDNDCDGDTDEPDALDAPTWYADADGDTYGDAATPTQACDAPTDHVADASDCDDAHAAALPGGTEVCDGLDNDCDGATDGAGSADATLWYADADGDGYGDAGTAVSDCSAPRDHVADATDCDDGEGSLNPGESEVCDGIDNDCDGVIDTDAVDAPCSIVLEDFEGGAWPATDWTVVTSGGSISTTAHDGSYGVEDPDWHYLTTTTVGQPGDILTAWVYGGTGRAYFGFDSDSGGTSSFVVGFNTDAIYFQENVDYDFSIVATTAITPPAGEWLYVEIETFTGGYVEGRLYSDEGRTLLAEVTHTFTTPYDGGYLAIRSFSDVFIDTITLYPG